MPTPKKQRNKCLYCGRETARPKYTYCNNACQSEYFYARYIEKWKRGEERGLTTTGVVAKRIKRFLREKFGNKCCLCGWCEINPSLGITPLIADHIDGNWKNNSEENLRLLCPNCDALTPTHGALNKGNGRPQSVVSARILEGRIMAQEKKI